MATDRSTPAAPGLAYAFWQMVPLAALFVVFLDTATDFFPDDPLVGVVTPTRLALLAGLLAIVVPVRGRHRTRLRDFRTRLDLPIALLLGAVVMTTFLGGHPTAPLRGLLTVIAGYYLVVGLRRTQPESWRAVGLLALVGIAAAGTSAFSQFTNETPTGFCRTGLLTDISCDSDSSAVLIRAIGTFANPNLLAAFLVLLLPFVLLASVSVDERTARTVIVLIGVVGYGALLTTFSRAGYVAGAAGLLVLGGAYWLAPRLADRAQRRITATLGFLALGGAAAAIWAASQAGNSLGVRGQAWNAALDIAVNNPLGVGLGRSGAVISATAPGERVFVHAHNMWLNWLVETGPLGLLALLSITLITWSSAARAARAKSAIGTVGLASLTGFFMIGMMDHPANLDRIDMLFWLILAMVMAEAPAGWRNKGDSTAAPKPQPRQPRHGAQPHRTTIPSQPSPSAAAVQEAAGRVRSA
ncbi:O-antigen ligase family protein [Streptomyces spinoverrucosus]|uniref:O-antigen ligase family protein n=1 Tax=Streptomyces spinoverrucosus TaxID=284043 RepID=UPI0018C45087|nr:O-antigen ligase family protein [Streptomyces spinoverrucosus]MBG0854502.1 O-antigen ligase family protein [Streptomyces spinoverrucosus]